MKFFQQLRNFGRIIVAISTDSWKKKNVISIQMRLPCHPAIQVVRNVPPYRLDADALTDHSVFIFRAGQS